MRRLDWLDRVYGRQLFQAARNDKNFSTAFLSSKDVVEHFSMFDPTANKRFTPWLVRVYLANGFLLEDLSKAQETIQLFLDAQTRLPTEHRDIGRYRSLSSLWKVVAPYQAKDVGDETPTGKMLRRAQKAAAYRDSKIIMESDNFTVAIPLTIEASKWWGRGTRWCTAAENDNYFHQYNNVAPLYVIDAKGLGKFQLFVPDAADLPPHQTGEQIQFMDANDEAVKPDFAKEHFALLKPLFVALAKRNGYLIEFIRPKTWTTKSVLMQCLNSALRSSTFPAI